MSISLDLIRGANVGLEYVAKTEDYDHTIIIDFLVVRMLIQWA